MSERTLTLMCFRSRSGDALPTLPSRFLPRQCSFIKYISLALRGGRLMVGGMQRREELWFDVDGWFSSAEGRRKRRYMR